MDAVKKIPRDPKIVDSAAESRKLLKNEDLPIRLSAANALSVDFRTLMDVPAHFWQFEKNAQGKVTVTYLSR